MGPLTTLFYLQGDHEQKDEDIYPGLQRREQTDEVNICKHVFYC